MKIYIKTITCFIFVVLFLGLSSFSVYLWYNYNSYVKYADVITKVASDYEIDPLLIISIIKAESNFNAYAISNKGAIGIMQIMPSTAKYLIKGREEYNNFNINDLYQPQINIDLGVYYIKSLLKVFDNDISLMLAAYNAGIGNVYQWYGNVQPKQYEEDKILFIETKKYVNKITRIYKILKFLF